MGWLQIAGCRQSFYYRDLPAQQFVEFAAWRKAPGYFQVCTQVPGCPSLLCFITAWPGIECRKPVDAWSWTFGNKERHRSSHTDFGPPLTMIRGSLGCFQELYRTQIDERGGQRTEYGPTNRKYQTVARTIVGDRLRILARDA